MRAGRKSRSRVRAKVVGKDDTSVIVRADPGEPAIVLDDEGVPVEPASRMAMRARATSSPAAASRSRKTGPSDGYDPACARRVAFNVSQSMPDGPGDLG